MRTRRVVALMLVLMMLIPTSIVHAYLTNGVVFGWTLKSIENEELPTVIDLNTTGQYEVTIRIWVDGLPYHNSELIYEVVDGETETVFMQGDKLIIGAETPTRPVAVRVVQPGEYFVAHTFSVIGLVQPAAPPELNGDNKLHDLEVVGYSINPAFDPDVFEYTLTVPFEVFELAAVTTWNPLSLVWFGERALKAGMNTPLLLEVGENTFKFIVEAENGTENTYTLVVNREHPLLNIEGIVRKGSKLMGENNVVAMIVDLNVARQTTTEFSKVLWRLFDEPIAEPVALLQGLTAGPFMNTVGEADAWMPQPLTPKHVVVGLYNTQNELVAYNVSFFEPHTAPVVVHTPVTYNGGTTLSFEATVEGLGAGDRVEIHNYYRIPEQSIEPVFRYTRLAERDGDTFTANLYNESTMMLRPTDLLYYIRVIKDGVQYIYPTNANVSAKTGFIGTDLTGVTPPTTPQEPTLRDYNDLTILMPINGLLNPGFNPSVTAYTVNVAYNTSFFGVNVSTMNGATIDINGEERQSIILDLIEGVNTITIVVTAENGETKTYTIAVTRAPAPVIIIPINNNNNQGDLADGSSGGGGSAGGLTGGSNEQAVPQPTPQLAKQPEIRITDGLATVKTGEGTVKAEGSEVKKLMDAGKPVILESTLATIDFGRNGLKVAEVTNNLTSMLELGAKITEESKTKAVLENANLEKAGLEALGGKVLDLIAQLNYSNGTSTRIRSFAEPVKVSINLKELGLEGGRENLTAVRFVPQADGSYKPIKLGGTYNAKTGNFEFYTDSFSLYSIVRADNIRKIILTIDSHDYTVDGAAKYTDAAPLIENSRTLVPLRVIAEALGAKVDWNSAVRTVKIELEGQGLTLVIDELIEGMDVPARLQGSRTMVPLRYISEKLGAYVMWFGDEQRIEIIK